MNPAGWVGVDLDSTLVTKVVRREGPGVLGEPIQPMIDRVRGWLAAGVQVRIFTARVWHDGSPESMLATALARAAIREFSVAQFGVSLPVTCEKDPNMIEMWDDRAVQVEADTGKVIGISRLDKNKKEKSQ